MVNSPKLDNSDKAGRVDGRSCYINLDCGKGSLKALAGLLNENIPLEDYASRWRLYKNPEDMTPRQYVEFLSSFEDISVVESIIDSQSKN